MRKIKDLREKRANAIRWARARNDQAGADGVEATRRDELIAEADRALDAASDLKEEIDREERILELERDEVERRAAQRPDPSEGGEGGEGGEGRRDASDMTPTERGILERLAARGLEVIDGGRSDRSQPENRRAAYDAVSHPQTGSMRQYATPEYRAGFRNYLTGQAIPQEMRALQADDFSQGGALVAPVDFQRDLIQAVDDLVYMRQWGTVRTLRGAQSVGYPSLDADPADADWTSELATGSADSTMALGGRELTPHPLAKRLLVSAKLLRLDPASEALVRERLAYKFAVTEEKAGLTGTGAQQPLGVFTASATGISTGRDVSTDNTTSTMTFDGLKNAKYNQKSQYRPRLRWLFHRDGVKQIAKLKDGNQRYLWEDSVRLGEPDRLLNIPAFMSEYVPATFTSGLYVGILGDFSFYWWADALGMTLQRLNELYAATNQIGFIGRLETDGMPVLEEAFTRVKLG